MTGIAVTGAGLGPLIGSPLFSRLIAAYGWRLSYMILGSAVLIIVILVPAFLQFLEESLL